MRRLECALCGRVYVEPKDYLKGTSRFRVSEDESLYFECSCKTCLVLAKGEYEWYSPTDKMSKEAASVFTEITEIGELPAIPSSVAKLQAIISNENSSSKEIEAALKGLPNLAIEVVKAANNMKSSSGQEITTIQHAVSFVGRQTVSDLIVASTIKEFKFKTKSFNQGKFWFESVVCGRIAETIVNKFKPAGVSSEASYLAASLLNIGKVVGAICFAEKTDTVQDIVANPKTMCAWDKAEKKVDAISHDTLGEVAAALWGFPEYVIHCISNHHKMPDEVRGSSDSDDIEFFDDDEDSGLEEEGGPDLQKVTALANQFTHWIMLQPERMNEKLFYAYAKEFGLSQNQTEAFGEQIIAIKEEVSKQF